MVQGVGPDGSSALHNPGSGSRFRDPRFGIRFPGLFFRGDSCITQLEAQGPSRTCNESKDDEGKGVGTPDASSALHSPGPGSRFRDPGSGFRGYGFGERG